MDFLSPSPISSSKTNYKVSSTARQFDDHDPGGSPPRRCKGRNSMSPLGKLIQEAMNRLDFSYQDIVTKSNRLASLNNNPHMRIGKSTLGNIIGGSIRQPSTAKLDALRVLLNLTQDQLDVAIGLAPERRFVEQLQLKSSRTHEVTQDAVTRHRIIRLPIIQEDVDLAGSQFLAGMVQRWATIEVEYLSSFYPPYVRYVVIGERDTRASPVAPPGTRVLVNTLVTEVRKSENIRFHERELYCILTCHGLTCSYLEHGATGTLIMVPHPLSGNVREELDEREVKIIGLVVGILLRSQ